MNRDPLYNDWLNLNLHLLWCYDHEVIGARDRPALMSRQRVQHMVRGTAYANSGAWLVRKGRARVEHDGKIWEAGPGEWLIVKPTKRVQSFMRGTEILSVAFDARWPDGSQLYESGLSLVVRADEFPALEKKAMPMVRLLKKFKPDTWDTRRSRIDFKSYLVLESLICKWFAALMEVLTAHGIEHTGRFDVDDRVMRAVRILNSHDPGIPLALGDLADSVGVSQTHLSRLFQRDLQTTPARYFEQLRVEHACNLLRQPDSRINEVSVRLGFNYPSYFSKWFKKHTGKPPRAFCVERNS